MTFNKSFIFIFFIILNKSLLKEESDEKLLFVWEHFRHGARGSYKSFDYINWKDILNEKWKGAGELTPIGMRMHYLLGVATRKKYNHFLSPVYNPNEIFVISTNVNRTLISAYSNLQGLYYKSKQSNVLRNKINDIPNNNYSRQIKNSDINIDLGINAFPVHIYDEKDLKFQLYRTEVCPGISSYVEKIRKSESIQKIYDDIFRISNESFGKYINKFMNKTTNENDNSFNYNFNDIKTICDSFIADYVDGREINDIKRSGINIEKFYDHCLNISLIMSYYNYYGKPNEKTVEIGISPTFLDIFDYMDKRIILDKKGISDEIISSFPKFVIVSSHDVSLAAIDLFLESKFGIKFKRADYASSQCFELWKNTKSGKYFVKYLINLETAGIFDFYDFKNKVLNELYSPEDIKKICFPEKFDDSNNNKQNKKYYYLFIILMILSTLLMICLFFILRKGKKSIFKENKLNIEMKEMSFANKIFYELK